VIGITRLECGKEFAFDWQEMRIGSRSPVLFILWPHKFRDGLKAKERDLAYKLEKLHHSS